MVRIPSALIALTASAGLVGCAYPGTGYGGVSVGYGTGGYYDDYYGYGSGYGYGAPYYGWYDGYYYPGAGYYIYDRGGHRHKWNDRHRRHWEGRRDGRDGRENWADFRRDGRNDRGEWRGRERDGDRGEWRGRQRGDGQAYRGGNGRGVVRATPAPAPGTTTPQATSRPDAAARDARRVAQREQRTVARQNREAARASRPQPSATRNVTRPAPANRGEAMRRMRDGDGPSND